MEEDSAGQVAMDDDFVDDDSSSMLSLSNSSEDVVLFSPRDLEDEDSQKEDKNSDVNQEAAKENSLSDCDECDRKDEKHQERQESKKNRKRQNGLCVQRLDQLFPTSTVTVAVKSPKSPRPRSSRRNQNNPFNFSSSSPEIPTYCPSGHPSSNLRSSDETPVRNLSIKVPTLPEFSYTSTPSAPSSAPSSYRESHLMSSLSRSSFELPTKTTTTTTMSNETPSHGNYLAVLPPIHFNSFSPPMSPLKKIPKQPKTRHNFSSLQNFNQSIACQSPENASKKPKTDPVRRKGNLAFSSISVLQSEYSLVEKENLLLPICDSSEDTICVSCETVAQIISKTFQFPQVDKPIETYIFDCRFEYEYHGGHLITAKLCTQELIRKLFLDNPIVDKRVVIILHCEFSSKRGPEMWRVLRRADRQLNAVRHPSLFYPDLYVMKKGYAEFFRLYPDLCEPKGYTKMRESDNKKHILYRQISM